MASIAPFLRDAGQPSPGFDFALPGVRSLSADAHKLGFCPKPASTLFFRDREDRERAAFDFDAWPLGRFTTGSHAGTRAGGAVAASWAVLRFLGRGGYLEIARRLERIEIEETRYSGHFHLVNPLYFQTGRAAPG